MEAPLSVAFLLLLSSLLVPLVLLARRRRSRRTPPFSLLVVAGSGGHTTEILRLLSCLSESYSPRHYVFADSDTMSEAKIRSFEQKRAETVPTSQFTLNRIPRSREVRQSWTSSVVTTLYSMLYSLPLTYRRKPDLILCNGPGTCVPVCISALLLGLLGIKRAIIVYVESICRVETLSLSGKILYYFSDYFIVQWPDLKEKYPKNQVFLTMRLEELLQRTGFTLRFGITSEREEENAHKEMKLPLHYTAPVLKESIT